jgi:nitroreductase
VKVLAAPGPTESEVEKFVTAAYAAPDYNEIRPWRLIALQGEALARVGDAFARSVRPTACDEQEAALLEAKARSKFGRSPFVLVIVCSPRDDRKVTAEDQLASAAAAAQNILLAATALGYGSMWRTDVEARDPGVRAALGLGDGDVIVGLLHVGTFPPDYEARARPQPAPELFTWWSAHTER